MDGALMSYQSFLENGSTLFIVQIRENKKREEERNMRLVNWKEKRAEEEKKGLKTDENARVNFSEREKRNRDGAKVTHDCKRSKGIGQHTMNRIHPFRKPSVRLYSTRARDDATKREFFLPFLSPPRCVFAQLTSPLFLKNVNARAHRHRAKNHVG
jgi:hypothetical protein